ncbi:MAG: PKD domain-containing protein [Silvibacterium sp.]
MRYIGRVIAFAVAGSGLIPCFSQAPTAATIRNHSLAVSLQSGNAGFEVRAASLDSPVFAARVGAEVNHQWLWSTDYPTRHIVESTAQDQLGPVHRIEVDLSGAAGKPDLSYALELYDDQPYGDVQVKVRNTGVSAVTVQNIRVMDMVGAPFVNLHGPESADRVLSDSFSEDRPPLRIFDLGKARLYEGEDSYADTLTDVHFAVGSQLLYNRTSGYSLFLAALTADKWVTLYHLRTQQGAGGDARISSYAVDCSGTTEVMKKESIHDSPTEQQVELSLELAPGTELSSEKVMFAAGRDYHAQLEAYGRAVRELRHALVNRPAPWGWWSWTAYYFGLSEGTARTNAEWLKQNLRSYGFNLFHIDEGYAYADGELTTPNATLFPHGIRQLGYDVSEMGLQFGMWVAPFRVSQRAYVYQQHPEWLVHDAAGKPIQIGFVEGSRDPLFVLDTTNPGAQSYLRETYRTLVQKWNVRYLKADFMDDTAIEGYHYRPNTTAIEAEQIGLRIIRDAIGPDVLLDKDGSPMLPAVGYTDLGRISTDTGHSYAGMREDATGIAARYYMNENFYRADPDAFTVSKQLITDQSWHTSKAPLTQDEAEVSIALAAVAGGMFEIGDDLPTLGTQPERLALIKNPDLLNLVRLGRAMNPVDLMTYRPEDGQPSIFFLREDDRQSMLVVFNWTDTTNSHTLSLRETGFSSKGNVSALDIFNPGRKVKISGDSLQINGQAPHSVRLIRLIDHSVTPQPPAVDIQAPITLQAGQTTQFRALTKAVGVPPLRYSWDFGDGTEEEGAVVTHAYTHDGIFKVQLRVDGLDGKPAISGAEVNVKGIFKTTYQVEDYRRYQGNDGMDMPRH